MRYQDMSDMEACLNDHPEIAGRRVVGAPIGYGRFDLLPPSTDEDRKWVIEKFEGMVFVRLFHRLLCID